MGHAWLITWYTRSLALPPPDSSRDYNFFLFPLLPRLFVRPRSGTREPPLFRDDSLGALTRERDEQAREKKPFSNCGSAGGSAGVVKSRRAHLY